MGDEFAEAKHKFIELAQEIDPEVVVVIPERSTLDSFRISLTRGGHRRMLSLSEDELLDLIEERDAAARMHARLRLELSQL
jgi:hypothetical protein